MRVNQSTSNPVQGSEVAGAKKTDRPEKKGKSQSSTSEVSGNESAKTEISSKGKEFASARAAANSAPDVREEKIAELKRRIQAGSYKTDPDAIADKMVDEHLKMEGMS